MSLSAALNHLKKLRRSSGRLSSVVDRGSPKPFAGLHVVSRIPKPFPEIQISAPGQPAPDPHFSALARLSHPRSLLEVQLPALSNQLFPFPANQSSEIRSSPEPAQHDQIPLVPPQHP